ncbi:aspartate kinase [Allocatelliglobosispora scoriae]|uniref:Aspartokinase n=1 Tax=Allocatelliglobosispora scoriae TaxID=643052 RepID=A0A841C3T7_9ACTN|nr:aspartate kinase [Allocatelliglobosispora scoriae]MBB5873630.1 aspartate kinase [Allocatelliglobosispora scoriae]
MGNLVQKFGGSSLGDIDLVSRAARIVEAAYRRGDRVVVVVSARGDTTDDLLALAEQTSPERPAREIDQLLATGETASAALMALALHAIGVPAVSLTGAQAGITAAGPHGAGVIAEVDPAPLTALLDRGNVAVVAGFQGVDPFGNVLTLGRGGSDTTAVALAAGLAARCEIYTDVEGIFTGDPRLVPDARLLPVITAPVMAEMAFAGARVMHSRAVELAALTNVELHVRSSASDAPGTTVASGPQELMEIRGAVIAITHDAQVARVLIQAHADLAREVFDILASLGVPADLVARSGSGEAEFRMGFTMPATGSELVRTALERAAAAHGGRVEVSTDVGKVSLVGTGMLNRPELTARMLAVLAGAQIPTSWVSATQLRTSVTVPHGRLSEAVVLLHKEFELQRDDYDIVALVAP